MPSCISVFSNVDFIYTTLPPSQDGFSIAIAQATPTPTPAPTTPPTPTPSPSPSDSPAPTVSPTATPAATPNPTASATPVPTNSPTATPAATPNPTASPTGTPVPTASATPIPTPSPTSAALCITVDGSTNNFTTTQLAGPDNGFSFFNNVIVNPTPTVTPVPPTPSPTPAAGFSTDACAPSSPTGYGSGFTMSITFQSANAGDPTSFVWFQMDTIGRLLHIDNAVDVGLDSAGLQRAAYLGNDAGCPGATNVIGVQNLKYSDMTGAGKDLAGVTLVGLAYTSSTVGGGPGPYTVWFE